MMKRVILTTALLVIVQSIGVYFSLIDVQYSIGVIIGYLFGAIHIILSEKP